MRHAQQAPGKQQEPQPPADGTDQRLVVKLPKVRACVVQKLRRVLQLKGLGRDEQHGRAVP